MSTAFDLLEHVRSGDLLLRDMGYFCLESLHEIDAAGACFITRIPEGTCVSDLEGNSLDLPEWKAKVGRSNPVEGRVVAMRIDPAKAAERKRRLRATARREGKNPTRQELALCEWVVVFTNVEAEVMSGEAVVQLYRLRCIM